MGSQAQSVTSVPGLEDPAVTRNRTSTGHIAGIDGLRAIAVLAVIVYHFMPAALPGGFVGVDIFFVISGYVVTCSLARSRSDRLSSFLAAFYVRRLLRIFPALIACLIVASVVNALVVPDATLGKTAAKTALAAFAGLSNFALIFFDDGYFSTKAEFNPFTHTWSLAVEEQFYVLFPLLFWFAARPHVGPLASRLARWAIPTLMAASLAIAALWADARTDWSYYLLPSRFWELGAGAMLALLHQRGQLLIRGPVGKELCTVAGLALIGVALVATDKAHFPFPWAIVPVLGTVLLILALTARTASGSASALASWPMAYVGRLSYSLYLWHWPIIVLMRWTVGADTAAKLFVATLATFVMAALSYHLVEDPVRHSRTLNRWPKHRTLIGGASVIALGVLFCGMVTVFQPRLSLSTTADKFVWSPEARYLREATPAPTVRDRGQVFVFGDSHAWAYERLLKRLETDEGIPVHTYKHYGCGIANLMRPTNPACTAAVEKDLAEIERRAQQGDILFLASLRMNRLSDQWGPFPRADVVKRQDSASAAQARAQALEQADALIARLRAKGLRVIIDAPKPVFAAAPFRCSDWFNAMNPSCVGGFTVDRAFLLAFRQPQMQAIDTLSKRHPDLLVWDTFSLLCPAGQQCHAFDGDKPKFFDGDHLSGYGNDLLYPAFRELILSLLPRPTQAGH